MPSPFVLVETPAFTAVVAGYVKDGHKKLPEDLAWLAGRLAEAPEQMGDHVPGLKNCRCLFSKRAAKTVATGSVHWRHGASITAIHKEKRCVFLLFLHHKKEYGNPGAAFLVQKMERALTQHRPKT